MFASLIQVLRLILAELEKIAVNTTPAADADSGNDAQG